MLPDVDADEGDVCEERVLVRGGDNLEALGGRVEALQSAVVISMNAREECVA